MNRLRPLVRDAALDAAHREAETPVEALRPRALARRDRRDFREALGPGRGEARLVAEVKRASPTRAHIRLDLDPVATARAFEEGGAAAISVLTEGRRFKGSLEDLARVREATTVPVMRKDFVVSPYMVYEAAAAGADAFVLIAAALEMADLESCVSAAFETGLDVLFEVGDEEDLEKARYLRPSIVGVNARDLRTFEIDGERHARLRDRISSDCACVAESGVRGPEDLERLRRLGYDAVLVGEVLSESADPGAAVRRLLRKSP